MIWSIILFCIFTISFAQQRCPQGGDIYARGLTQDDMNNVVELHNKYRLDIANGRVPGQPRGNNLKRIIYDATLGQKGQIVSNSCQMVHKPAFDNRWGQLGQNLYISWSATKITTPDWNAAVKSWFDEKKNFKYPTGNIALSGHYTQVVWADSKNVGCDFVAFYDVTAPSYPYARLYTCNYGPAGNIIGNAPYKTGSSGCENLC